MYTHTCNYVKIGGILEAEYNINKSKNTSFLFIQRKKWKPREYESQVQGRKASEYRI